jgi:very-short-patch-repair endonuclease
VSDVPTPSPSRKREGNNRAEPTPLPLAGGVGGGRFQPRNTHRARELRNQATPAERLMWTALSNRKVAGFKFSRQMPVGPYFADFLCREMKLIVELDGFSHNMRVEHDRQRDQFLVSEGYTIVRFTNEDVLSNLDGVVQAIAIALANTRPPPTPPAGGWRVRMTRSSC